MPETRDKGWILDDSSLVSYVVNEKEREKPRESDKKDDNDVQKSEKL